MQDFMRICAASTLVATVGCSVGREALINDRITTVIAERLPDLGVVGFAGPFVGESNGVLLAGGGTNFPGDPPWKQGKKVWYDDVYAYDGNAWKIVGKLPKPNAVGACVTTSRGVMVIGGGDSTSVFADVFLLRYEDGTLHTTPLPALPRPVMGSSAVLVGDRVFLVGGHDQISPMASGPLREVYSLSVSNPTAGWQTEVPMPGDARWLPVVGSDGTAIFVISGMTPRVDVAGKKVIHCLEDVWKYVPSGDGRGNWTRLPDLPRANAAAPSPAPFMEGELILVGGGVDDSNFGKPMDQRPPFPSTITAINPITGEARVIGDVESSVVAAPVVPWHGGWVVVSGEIRAGVRSPAVWKYTIR